MTSDELLQQLKDIQAPAEPAWWLIAPAWFWSAAACMLLVGAAWLAWQRRHNEQLARLAQRELQQIAAAHQQHQDARLFALAISRWLKQVAMLAFPERHLQALHGKTWLEFLDLDFTDRPFSRGCGRLFGADVYRRDVSLDAGQVIALCERWLGAVKPRLQTRSGAR